MSADRCHVVAGTMHPCSRVARVLAEGGDTAACFRWLREDAGEVLWCLACGARPSLTVHVADVALRAGLCVEDVLALAGVEGAV